METRFNSEYFFFHDQVFVLAHGDGGVEHRWLPGTFRISAAALIPPRSAVISQCLLSQVGEKSTAAQAQCLCNHLTLYGSSFFVMPNDVDISRTAELFATVSHNYVVLALLCAFFGLYLITLLWACYADRRSRTKVSQETRLSVVALHKQQPGTDQPKEKDGN